MEPIIIVLGVGQCENSIDWSVATLIVLMGSRPILGVIISTMLNFDSVGHGTCKQTLNAKNGFHGYKYRCLLLTSQFSRSERQGSKENANADITCKQGFKDVKFADVFFQRHRPGRYMLTSGESMIRVTSH